MLFKVIVAFLVVSVGLGHLFETIGSRRSWCGGLGAGSAGYKSPDQLRRRQSAVRGAHIL